MPTVDDLRKRETALFRVAVTRASRKLILSRPVADSGGSPLLESEPLNVLKKWLGDSFNSCVKKIFHDPPVRIDDSVFPTDIACIALSGNFDDKNLTKKLSEKCSCGFNLAVKSDEYDSVKLKDGLDLLREATGSAEKPISATRLNQLAQCPYWFFSSSLLKLKDLSGSRIKNGFDHVVAGSLAHAALEEWFKTGKGYDISKPVMDEFSKIFAGIPETCVTDARVRQLIYALNRFMEFERNHLSKLGFRQKYAELKFSGDGSTGSLTPAEIFVSSSYTLILGGVIDRIDIASANKAIVADYKLSPSGAASSSEAAKKGLNFQLACYIALATEKLDLDVVLAMFIPLTETTPESLRIYFVHDGYDTLVKNAGLKTKSETISPEEHLEKAKLALTILFDSISTGAIEPNPNDPNVCGSTCAFNDLCRFRYSGEETYAGGDEV